MAKHVIYGAFGLLSALAIAAAIYFEKPASGVEAEVSSIETAEPEDQSASIAIAGGSAELYKVSKVIDGDTITVKIAGETETVRLIGIDAPETGMNAECFAVEATNALKHMLGGDKIRLEKDSTQGERDKYDRLLAYVFTESGVNVSEELIENGFAKEYTYSKTYRYQKEFKAAQKRAEGGKVGLWAPSACAKPTPAVTQKATEEPKTQPKVQSVPKEETASELEKPKQKVSEPEPEEPSSVSVDTSSYTCSANTYNCSDFPTHAEAQAVFEHCGGASNDIHKLDRDKDGQVCESRP